VDRNDDIVADKFKRLAEKLVTRVRPCASSMSGGEKMRSIINRQGQTFRHKAFPQKSSSRKSLGAMRCTPGGSENTSAHERRD